VARLTPAYLYDLQRFGIKAGLENIRALLAELGTPAWPCVHVAGTNGKGSTASMIAAVLTAAGYRVGLYTSPHLVRFNERIRVNGKMIADADIARLTRALRPVIDRRRATFFEATTAIAFQAFAEAQIDIAVIETGLGGRLDATNVVTPLVAVITNVEIDHAAYLGSTHRRIALEKAGIIKPGVPCVTAARRTDVLDVLGRRARQMRSPLENVRRSSAITVHRSELTGMTLDVRSRTWDLRRLEIPLGGFHQEQNVALALAALGRLRERFPVSERDVRSGFRRIAELSGIRGRMEIVGRHPLLIADVAHNPAAVAELAGALGRLLGRKAVTVFGVMRDKELLPMLDGLRNVTRLLVAVAPHIPRALPSGILAAAYRETGGRSVAAPSVAGGLALALEEARPGEPILITGSHYVVGEAFEELDFLE
jgi:dihydrofolate synthase/folylpolyglutamate synthase